MALKVSAPEAAKIAIQSIGRGYDISVDLRLKYCKGDLGDSRLIEIGEDLGREIVLPGGIVIPNVLKSIKCDKGERTRFRSDVLPFQEMSEQFNQEISLTGKIPSGLFNATFEFSGCWQKDAANTKTLAFDGVFITLYTIALEKSQMVLHDHVKKAVPSTWEPAALARFIETYGTHIIVGVKMGGKDVIYLKQQHSSALQPADVQKRLKAMADKRFLDANGQYGLDPDQVHQSDQYQIREREQRLRFADTTASSSYSHKEDIVSIFKRRGGSDRNLTHNEWLHTVQFEPDVISMSFIPITSLLSGVSGSGFLSHAINLYLRYKPPIEELHQFLEFQLPRQWAPLFNELPLGPQRRQHSTASLQFSFMGPKLYVNSTPQVYVGKRPITGLRLYLEGKRSNRLAIHLQHLSSLPKIFNLEDDPNGNFHQESYDRKYYEKVQWKNFSHVCTAPVESDEDLSIVTGAQLQVGDYGFKKILFLRLRFSTVSGATVVKHPEWDGSPGLARKSGLISTLISHRFTTTFTKPPPQPSDVNINSAVYPGGPPVPVQAPKLLKFVDLTEMTRGPQETPGYWVVSGARLIVEKGRISLRVKYSLLTVILPDDDEVLEDF
ncbi:MACPF domain-containing protein At4g24290-like isoform X1 [Actinidia eriantha]|uniref:MACPF domain-containing protein At4g24290-like isoform X1 n=1 Tax=Actinidia eriantha TaxID=165200 RepID=UPI002589AEB7|nr:MACPF domain-containing protein At4g24290-like isoform X1 [Actinidia eriantha]